MKYSFVCNILHPNIVYCQFDRYLWIHAYLYFKSFNSQNFKSYSGMHLYHIQLTTDLFSQVGQYFLF